MPAPPATIRAQNGVYSGSNPFSAVPEGALTIGENVVIRSASVLEPRPGFKLSVGFTGDRCFPFPTTSKLLVMSQANGTVTLYDPDTNGLYQLNRSSGPFSLQGPYSADPRVRIQAAAANGNIYFTTAQGIQCAPAIAAPLWRCAGLPPPWGTVARRTGVGTSFAGGRRRTYRFTFGLYDELGNYLEGPPSEPMFVQSAAGSAAGDVTYQIQIPLGLPPKCFLRAYRAPESSVGVPSSDEMFWLGNSDQISLIGGTNLFVDPNTGSWASQVFVDNGIDDGLALPLYTNPRTGDGLGIAGKNDAPPAAGAIAFFKNRMYYGRCTFRQGLQIQIIGTQNLGGTGDSLTPLDVLSFDGVSLIAATTGNPDFGVDTGLSAFDNVTVTGVHLARAINSVYCNRGGLTGFDVAFANTQLAVANRSIMRQLRATYISLGPNDKGRILLERPFPAPLADDPGIPFGFATSGKGIRFPNGVSTSTDNYFPGSIAWSKIGQPEAVPPVNTQVVGDPRSAVLGFSVHRDVMFVWKEDGVYVARDDGGRQPTFSLLDPSVNVISPDTIGVVDNAAYALTSRGVLQVTEQGTTQMAEPVRADLLKKLSDSPSMAGDAFAVAYDTERQYILAIPSNDSERAMSTQYVLRVPDFSYPPTPPKWTNWKLPGLLHGCVTLKTTSTSSDRPCFVWALGDQAYGANALQNPLKGVQIMRRGGAVSGADVGNLWRPVHDYVDFTSSLPNPATTTTDTLVFPNDMHQELFVGDMFAYNPGGIGTKVYWMRVLSVSGATVGLDNKYPFTTGGTLQYYRGIQAHWRFAPITLGEPTVEKQWAFVQAYFDYFDGDWIEVALDSEKSPPSLNPYSIVPSDPLASNYGGTVYTSTNLPGQATLPGPNNPPSPVGTSINLRRVRDVVLRVDPGPFEARAARLGVEMRCAQALAFFRLLAISAVPQDITPVTTR
jgi:hypothetical protein